MKTLKSAAKTILSLLSKVPGVYKAASKIADYYRSENNCDILTNGEMYFLKTYVSKFETIFDVGANVGEWTIEVASLAPKAQIHTFEPSKKTFETLRKNISPLTTHKKERIHLYNIGLGESRGDKTFYIYGEESTLNSTHKRDFDTQNTETVQIDTIDQFCTDNKINRINFLKIDTEGNEINVLKGAQMMIKEGKIDSIQIEYGGTYIEARVLLKDVFNIFKGSEYSLYKMHPSKLEPVEYSEDLENFKYANYIAAKKDFILKNK